MINKLLKYINQHTQLSKIEERWLAENIQFKELAPNELLLKDGDYANAQYLVIDGCVRMYYNHGNCEKTAFFFFEGQYIWCGESFYFNTPLKENYRLRKFKKG